MTELETLPEVEAGMGPATRRVVEAVEAAYPAHAKYLRRSFAARSPGMVATAERVADLILRLVAGTGRSLESYAQDYRYFVEEIVFPEELFFRREGRYRLSSFAEAERDVYANRAMMARYMDGLLVSDCIWLNHVNAMTHFADTHLAGLPAGGAHLEIGPGHGLLLRLAIESGRFGSIDAWDISETSIAHTREVLGLLGHADRVRLTRCNFYDAEMRAAHAGRFTSIAFSEVLEHLEEPGLAIEVIRGLLAPGGLVWINVPANAPAPDHLYLVRAQEEVEALVAAAGLELVETRAFPAAGESLERALRLELPVTYILVARCPR
ncbi:class I SAM-dependent methyltransferase (plasmid) [Paroceanicella profunda]|uniref:Class I SAM-dependent methyltransferase n=1 Tax=Paroceanicella profunda TaxID=2579971 RepID=A0A5B8G085_9RHOB|nr:class I SAM-dependent methyltransferase [Paroceanicella profunda]QDL94556.1 class I SAM-dependent methyltransferase [Paroceanicella profunda]